MTLKHSYELRRRGAKALAVACVTLCATFFALWPEVASAQQLRPIEAAHCLGTTSAPRGAARLTDEWEETRSLVATSSDGSISCVEVFWTPTGLDAPPLADADGSGAPDYVELVAFHAQRALERAASEGFRAPLVIAPSGELKPCGVAGRVPVYLREFPAGDGQLLRLSCRASAQDAFPVCASALTLENDFDGGFGYDDLEQAISVVTSHELFHAVQAAYHEEIPGWLSEGSATWFEELYDPSQRDFERLTTLYFDDHDRSLTDRQRGPFDGFSYGASIFFYYLHERYGVEVLLEALERYATNLDDRDFELSLQGVLETRGVSLIGAFMEFARYNIFTASRSDDAYGYPMAERFAAVTLEGIEQGERAVDVALKIDPMAARYFLFTPSRPGTLGLKLAPEWSAPLIELVDLDDPAATTSGGTVSSLQPLAYEAGRSYVILLGASRREGSHAGFLQIRPAPEPEVMEALEPLDLADMSSGEPLEEMGSDLDSSQPPDFGQQGGPDLFDDDDSTNRDAGGCSQPGAMSRPGRHPFFHNSLIFLLLYVVLMSALILRRGGGYSHEDERWL